MSAHPKSKRPRWRDAAVPIVVALITAVGSIAAAWVGAAFGVIHPPNRDLQRQAGDLLKETDELKRTLRKLGSSPENVAGSFEWQWAGANWLGEVTIERQQGAEVARIIVREMVRGKWEFKHPPVLESSQDGKVIRAKDSLKLELPVRGYVLDTHSKRMVERYSRLEAELFPTVAYAGEVKYVDQRGRPTKGDMVLVGYASRPRPSSY